MHSPIEVNKIYNEDCLITMKNIPNHSVDLIIADPPYYKRMLKDTCGNKYDWDNQWNSFEDYINWNKLLFSHFERILKITGSLYIFTDIKISAHLQIELDKKFNLENIIIWHKKTNLTRKGWKFFRQYTNVVENILFYSKEPRSSAIRDNNPKYRKLIAPLVDYFKNEKNKIKQKYGFKTDAEFNEFISEITKTRSIAAKHYFSYSQYELPTKERYLMLQSIDKGIFKRDYEELRRPFNQEENYTNVWSFPTIISKGFIQHPTQKPIEMIKRIINVSSRPNDLVYIPFLGSGTSAIAARKLSRKFIASEIKTEYCEIAIKRLKKEKMLF